MLRTRASRAQFEAVFAAWGSQGRAGDRSGGRAARPPLEPLSGGRPISGARTWISRKNARPIFEGSSRIDSL
eukprot:4892331-Alexandrium_andersonii.AAC.1